MGTIPFGPDAKIAMVPRGGPENGPNSAMAVRVFDEVFTVHGYKISGIYTSSGSTPTALLGCTGNYAELCHTWANLTPRDVVGKVSTFKTGYRVLTKDSLLSSHSLRRLIEEKWNLEEICSPSAIAIKYQAVDLYSRQSVTFSNKDPRHKPYLLPGALGAMAIVPFLEPQPIYNPKGAGLIDDNEIRNNSLLLVDGGYRSNMMLEMAMRDDFDVIFVIDVHGLKPTENKFKPEDLNSKFAWAKLLRNCFHILSNANDVKQYQLAERANEEIWIRDEILDIAGQLPVGHTLTDALYKVIDRMDNGRLRLHDKKKAQIYTVAREEYSTLFNFAKFKPQEPRDLLDAGWLAAVDTLNSLGFDTSCVMPRTPSCW